MRETKRWRRFARVGSLLLLFACLGLVGGGLIRILKEGLTAAVGWVMFSSGFVLTFATVNQWGRILPGVFGFASANAVITFWSGHQINQPNVLMPRGVALVLAVMFLSAAVLSSQIATREFNAIHRGVLVTVFILLLLAMLWNQFAISGAAAAVVCLFVLWLYQARGIDKTANRVRER